MAETHRALRRRVFCVFQQNTKVTGIKRAFLRQRTLYEGIRIKRVVESQAMRDHRRRRHLALLDQVQEALHVALLGEAHVREGVIVSSFFISRIVAARAVGH